MAVHMAELPVHNIVLSENMIYLMGLSFVLGSFFTILVLILLDFMRRDRSDTDMS